MSIKFLKSIKLLLALICLIPEVAFSASENVDSCECQQMDWEKAFNKAEHVVFGEVKTMRRHSDDLATGEFTSMEAFKGDSTFIKKVVGRSREGGGCRLVLKQGFYILYSTGSNSVVLNECEASMQLDPKTNLASTLIKIKKYSGSKMPAESIAQERKEAKKEVKKEKNTGSDWMDTIMSWFN